MRTVVTVLTLTAGLVTGPALGAQQAARIIAVIPSSGTPGEELDVVVRGVDTHFAPGVSTADFGPGIRVIALTVTDPVTATAHLLIDSKASPGPRDIRVTTGSEVVLLENGFTVQAPTTQFRVSISVVPVETIFISDIDPTNIANAPLLFTVNLFNDVVARDVRLCMTIRGQRYGIILEAFDHPQPLAPFQNLSVTNREFDSYSTTNVSDEVIDIATRTGVVPPDVYTYEIRVYEATKPCTDPDPLASDEGVNVITNPSFDLELIAPGAPFDEEAPAVTTSFPVFQWVSQASFFNVTLYKVMEGQTDEDAVQNQPVFHADNITGTSLIYPNYAEALQDGMVYAWQVKALIQSATGTVERESKIFRFRVARGEARPTAVHHIVIEPDVATVNVGESISFTARVYDSENNPVSFTPQWSLRPADLGTIDLRGNFRAGDQARVGAVVVSAGEVFDHAVVTVVAPRAEFDFSRFLKRLFGLPDSTGP